MGLKTNTNTLAKSFKNPNITIDWARVETIFNGKNTEDYLIQNSRSLDVSTVKTFSDNSVKMNVINLMSTPEYQLM